MEGNVGFCYQDLVRRPYRSLNCVVVFMDLVGFTKRKWNKELHAAVQVLESAISSVLEDYKWDEDEPKTQQNHLILCPTGDGYAICFHNSLRDTLVLEHTAKIHKNLVEAGLHSRIGIHKGEIFYRVDLNGTMNVVGWGINLAARIMSLAEKNQMLCSQYFAEPLATTAKIGDLVKLPGRYRIKNMEAVTLYNYFRKNEFGNPKPPVRT